MNVLLIGSGGREHALAWALSKSPKVDSLFVDYSNAGIAGLPKTKEAKIADSDSVGQFCLDNNIEFVVVGPETPLVNGVVDELSNLGIKSFGPTAAAAQLEGSKGFTKDLCKKVGIPTAKYERFYNVKEAKSYILNSNMPIVVKADGLAAGKGVVVASTETEALDAVDSCFSGDFGIAGEEVVIEECLFGKEVSYFVLTDGENILPFKTAQDHKRINDGNKGPNTGGMGAYSPADNIMNESMEQRIIEEIIKPTIKEMKDRGSPFKGVLYAGLMITESGPNLIEYNVRFGDPECQVLMVMLESDLMELLLATENGTLDTVNCTWYSGAATTIVMAANGYPGHYEKGTPITGIETAESDPDVVVFHAGTKSVGGKIFANGGRVLNVTARGESIEQARNRAYSAVEKIQWEDAYFRRDIAKDGV